MNVRLYHTAHEELHNHALCCLTLMQIWALTEQKSMCLGVSGYQNKNTDLIEEQQLLSSSIALIVDNIHL